MKMIMKIFMKNNIRQNLKLLKNYGFIFVIFFIVILFSKEWILTAMVFIESKPMYLDCIIGGTLFAVFLCKKSPLVKIEPATIHYLMGTGYLERILSIKLILTFILLALLAVAVNFLKSGHFNMISFCNLTLLLIAGVFLHEKIS